MKIHPHILFFISFYFLGNNIISAQQDTLTSDEYQVIKDFDAQLENVDKVDIYPPLPSLDTQRQIIYYSVEPKLLDLEYDAPSIQPLELENKTEKEIYNGFIKTGIGYPLGGIIEGGYQWQQDRFLIGGRGQINGLYNDWQLKHQNYWQGNAAANAEYFFDQGYSLSTDLSYDYQDRNFYGYDHEVLTFEREQVKQYISLFDSGLDFKNNALNPTRLDYEIGGNFYAISDNYIASEIGTEGHVRIGKHFNKKHLLEIKIKNEWLKNNSEDIDYTDNLLAFIPSFTYHHNIFRIKAGINLSLLNIRLFPQCRNISECLQKQCRYFSRMGWPCRTEQFQENIQEESFHHI